MGWKEFSDKLKEWYGYSEAKNQDDIIIDIYNSQRLAGSYKMSHTDPWCHAPYQRQHMPPAMPEAYQIPAIARLESRHLSNGEDGRAGRQILTIHSREISYIMTGIMIRFPIMWGR